MQQQEKRGASRVACRVPLRVLRPPGWPPVSLEDVSATGVRLQVSLAHMEVEGREGLTRAAHHLEEAFRSDLAVEFDPDRLGSLIRHRVKIVRMGPFRDGNRGLELGGVLEPPLSEPEAAAMGLDLPETSHVDVGSGLRTTYRALVVPRGRPGVTAFMADVEALDTQGVRVRLARVPHVAAGGVAGVLVGLLETYGSELVLQIADGPRHVWTGEVLLASVEERGDASEELLLSFHYARPLAPTDCERLQLV